MADNSYQGDSYIEQGTMNVVTKQAGKIGHIGDASIVVGAEAANVINVAIQLKDAAGDDLATIGTVWVYLSDSAAGDGVVATAPDGAVAIGTDGSVLAEPAVKKVFLLGSEADGDIDLNIGHSLAKTLYLVVILPSGKKIISSAITFA